MRGNIFRTAGALAVAVTAVSLLAMRGGASAATPIPSASFDDALARSKGGAMAVFSGGCFWGVQAVFQHVKGVTSAVSGYAGGEVSTANYERVSDGNTGHAESVRVTFDTSEVTYGQLLKVFFSVVHDPTQLNYQGPDHGTQYRSEIWYTTPQQKAIAESYIAQLTKAKAYPAPIVTKVEPLTNFFPAEAYHQDYLIQHPNQPYIVYNDVPKVAALKKMMPELWRESPVLVGMAK